MTFRDNLITAVCIATVIMIWWIGSRKEKLIKKSKEYFDFDGESLLEPLPEQVLTRMECKKRNLVFRAECLSERLSRAHFFDDAKKLAESPQFIELFLAAAYTKKCDLGPSGRALRKHVDAVLGVGWRTTVSASDIKTWCSDVSAWMDSVRVLGVPASKKKAAEAGSH